MLTQHRSGEESSIQILLKLGMVVVRANDDSAWWMEWYIIPGECSQQVMRNKSVIILR